MKHKQTLLIEVKGIENTGPMTTEIINNVQSHVPLLHSQLLTMKNLWTSGYLLLQTLEKNTTHSQRVLGKMHKKFIQALQEKILQTETEKYPGNFGAIK